MPAPDSPSETTPPRNPILLGAGVLLCIAGFAVLLGQRYRYLTPGDFTIYSGLGVLLTGMAAVWLSGLPRDKAMEWVKGAVFALVLALTIRWAIAEPYRIPSISMEPTLHGDPHFLRGDRVFVNKWVYGLRWPFLNKRIWEGVEPQRWDIVVFKTVEDDAVHPTLVKRIVGMPGEHINIRDGKIYANGKEVPIPHSLPEDQYYTADELSRSMKYGVRPEPEYSEVPPGHYLVLGDNSPHSRDGRYFGWLPEEHIVGRVACIWWPLDRIRDFTGFSDTWWWKTTLLLLGLFTFVRLFIGQSWPVLMEGSRRVQHIFVSFAALGLRLPFVGLRLIQWGAPPRGSLVLYTSKDPRVPSEALLFGRVVALPGETVEIDERGISVNGRLQELPCWTGPVNAIHPDPQAVYARNGKDITVPPGHYFLLADPPTEANALDSRLLGWVPARDILGVATWVWWPIRKWRKL
jgi:signal peptidase I